MTSAMIEIATSSGVAAPMSSPQGECTRARSASSAPAASSRSRRSRAVRWLPSAPM